MECQLGTFLSRKTTVHFKLSLKTDDHSCKVIFKFGRRFERPHSASKRLYKDHFCVAKHLLGKSNPWTASGGCRLCDCIADSFKLIAALYYRSHSRSGCQMQKRPSASTQTAASWFILYWSLQYLIHQLLIAVHMVVSVSYTHLTLPTNSRV